MAGYCEETGKEVGKSMQFVSRAIGWVSGMEVRKRALDSGRCNERLWGWHLSMEMELKVFKFGHEGGGGGMSPVTCNNTIACYSDEQSQCWKGRQVKDEKWIRDDWECALGRRLGKAFDLIKKSVKESLSNFFARKSSQEGSWKPIFRQRGPMMVSKALDLEQRTMNQNVDGQLHYYLLKKKAISLGGTVGVQ